MDGIKVAGSKAASAADAVLLVYVHFSGCFIEDQAAVGTFLLAASATAALTFLDIWFSAAVLLGFSGTGTAAHANVFDGAAEAGRIYFRFHW